MMNAIKQQLILHCNELLEKRLQVAQVAIKSIEEAFASETKSSAGDKHETGRAMLQLEREKAGERLKDAETMLYTFHKIRFDAPSSEEKNEIVKIGNLVKTTNGIYFIATSLGVVTMDNTTVYCVSAQAPIGKLLLGKSTQSEFSFQQKNIQILEIY
ncbi:3-oxoacyl-ACP synthase [Joostella sp. CR20]|uniref:3-oxoacyl-ACP synthase n=1 Tax=Joostella sp. CR20 TaxID=2804312 RepID=UPI00313E5438